MSFIKTINVCLQIKCLGILIVTQTITILHEYKYNIIHFYSNERKILRIQYYIIVSKIVPFMLFLFRSFKKICSNLGLTYNFNFNISLIYKQKDFPLSF